MTQMGEGNTTLRSLFRAAPGCDHGRMTSTADRCSLTSRDLRRALEDDELTAWYQPMVRLSDGVVCGFEALARWRHPELGLLPASAFIPLAEACGLVGAIDDWMRRTVFHQLVLWQDDVLVRPGFRMTVNVSAVSISRPRLADEVNAAIEQAGVDPRGVVLELSEPTAIDGIDAARRSAHDLHDLGVEIGVDGFRARPDALELLRALSLDVVKLDRAVVADSTTMAGRVRAAAVVALASQISPAILAEGVETYDEAALLRALGCDEAQGFHWRAALSSHDAEALLAGGLAVSAVGT
jgi:EAL domain-containing protein (putative c-di-GMP-specific phosphodiesterase class I)